MGTLSRVVFDPDTTPPSAPGSVLAAALSQSAIRITWLPSTDTGGSGLAGYRVLRSLTSGGTYAQIGSDLSVASLSYDDSGLAAGTTYFYRVVAFDGNANVSSPSTTASATTQAANPGTGLIFPLHAPPYASTSPGVGGYGMNTEGGSGRHLGAASATTVFLITSPADSNTGSAITGHGANVHSGTWEYYWRHSASPKVGIQACSGALSTGRTIPLQTGTPPRPGYVTYYGQFAPAPGFVIRNTNVSMNGASNVVMWHAYIDMGDVASASLPAGARDCLSSGYGGGVASKIVVHNASLKRSVDEIAGFYDAHMEVTFVDCAFYEPLHDSVIDHPEDPPTEDHGFGPYLGGGATAPDQSAGITYFRCLTAHVTGRGPMVSARTFTFANCLNYNNGRPTGINADGNSVQILSAGASEANHHNFIANGFLRGPNNRDNLVAISVTGTYPAGSSGYAFGNCQRGWAQPANQAAYFTSRPASYGVSATIHADAYPSSWGSGLSGVLLWAANPQSPTTAEWHAYIDLFDRTVGATPAYRDSRLQLVMTQMRNAVDGVVQTNQFVNTTAESGGTSSVPVVVVDPLNPGVHWHAPLPTGSDRDTPYTTGTFSNGLSRVGYTRLEAWAYEQHLYVTAADLISPTVPQNVQAAPLSQTTLRITWDASTDPGGSGLAGYRVFRSTTSTGTYTQIGSDLSVGTTSYDDTTLSAGTTRFYRVLAFDARGNASAQSATASATTTSLPSGNWQDATVGFSAIPAQLSGTDGRKVRMDISGSDWGALVDDINGASVTRVVGGAFDGTDAIRIVPPSSQLNNGNKTTYSCVMRDLDISNSGAKNVAQTNLGVVIQWGSRYIDLAATAKITGVLAAQTQGGAPNASLGRAGWFEATWNGSRIFSVTATTIASYHQPVSGIFPDSGLDVNKLCFLGTTINHAADPPRVGQEWLYIEQEVDYRRNRGNPDGRNRLDVWSRTGYIGYLEIPLTHRDIQAPWDFSYQFGSRIEYIGGLWNNPSTANANNFLMVSHPIVSVNRAKDARIGPPPGFLT